MRRLSIVLAALILLGGCGGGPSIPISRDDRSTTDFFRLDVSIKGPVTQLSGSSHEWYSPGSGLYRAETRTGDTSSVTVYDGSAITKLVNGRIFRVEGGPAMLRYFTAHSSSFAPLGTIAVRTYLGHVHQPGFSAHAGGRSFDFDFHLGFENGRDDRVHATVHVRGRMSLREARSKGLLEAPTGRLAGELRQSPPGTHPRFGEHALWFGPRLPGGGKAVTALEMRGSVPGGESAPIRYMTVYRLPRSAIPANVPVHTAGTYPGLGGLLPIDRVVLCTVVPSTATPDPLTAGSPITLADGTHARADARAVYVGHTRCDVGSARLMRFVRRMRSL
jgi:hypothetical protein